MAIFSTSFCRLLLHYLISWTSLSMHRARQCIRMLFPSIDLCIIMINIWTCVIDLHLEIGCWLFKWMVGVGAVLAMNLVTNAARTLTFCSRMGLLWNLLLPEICFRDRCFVRLWETIRQPRSSLCLFHIYFWNLIRLSLKQGSNQITLWHYFLSFFRITRMTSTSVLVSSSRYILACFLCSSIFACWVTNEWANEGYMCVLLSSLIWSLV